MRFREPTDSKILVFLFYSARTTVGETSLVVERVGDYVGDRLGELEHHGYVKKPKGQRGIYQLTSKGIEHVQSLNENLHERDLDQLKEYIPRMLEQADLGYAVNWDESEVRHPEWFDA